MAKMHVMYQLKQRKLSNAIYDIDTHFFSNFEEKIDFGIKATLEKQCTLSWSS